MNYDKIYKNHLFKNNNHSFTGASAKEFSDTLLRPYKVSVHYEEMFGAMRTIHFDSPEQVWKHLVRPIDEKYAKYGEVHSFSKELLAEELRDFLLKHLDFIKHIAKVINKPFEIFEPIMDTQSSNGRVKGIFFKANQANEMELALAAA